MTFFLVTIGSNIWRRMQWQLCKYREILSVYMYSSSSSIRNVGILAHVDAVIFLLGLFVEIEAI